MKRLRGELAYNTNLRLDIYNKFSRKLIRRIERHFADKSCDVDRGHAFSIGILKGLI